MTQRIHVTGGPGSGKTTAARRIARELSLPFYELDQILIEAGGDMARLRREDRAAIVADQEEWVSEGAFFDWARPLFECAQLVVWLDLPWRVASYRILVRYLKAELARKNQHPGLRRLREFWTWSYRYYHDAHPHALNQQGVPLTRARAVEELRRYEQKLAVCRSKRDVDLLVTEQRGGTTKP
ncbi:MAG: shikimate kinase [Dehalococcoidia bacterium]